ncbi:hypothetical protein [Paenibacillus protaetiae]|uniref:Tyr recombinase domain-containing protein n=1 Tax=Paenibacillus protaetiae TaxID=2509456 RepID=A0A4P6EPY0_9BACL|nr:hypothetical protein [Paenibacillus protaetiae]QAY65010.1 hypothetical protein ET464_00030 [Paenibacillus protaetiae]
MSALRRFHFFTSSPGGFVFAGKKLKDINHGHYQDFIFCLEETKRLAPSSICSIHALLTSLFKHAVKRGQIGVSPATGAVLPKEEGPEDEEDEIPNYLERDQLLAVIRATKSLAHKANHPREAFGWRQFSRVLFILAHTGMRIGELGALEQQRVDTKKLTIKIVSTLYEKRGLRNYEIGPQ